MKNLTQELKELKARLESWEADKENETKAAWYFSQLTFVQEQ